jgi:hypothetical protein
MDIAIGHIEHLPCDKAFTHGVPVSFAAPEEHER